MGHDQDALETALRLGKQYLTVGMDGQATVLHELLLHALHAAAANRHNALHDMRV